MNDGIIMLIIDRGAASLYIVLLTLAALGSVLLGLFVANHHDPGYGIAAGFTLWLLITVYTWLFFRTVFGPMAWPDRFIRRAQSWLRQLR